MKALWITAFVLTFSSASNAMVQDGWERPVARAQMTSEAAQGLFAEVAQFDLVMHQRDGEQAPTLFSVSVNGTTASYKITSLRGDGCGSRIYNATLISNSSETLELIDHSSRMCMDFVPHTWTASVTRVENAQVVGQILAHGDAQSVFTVTGVKKKLPQLSF